MLRRITYVLRMSLALLVAVPAGAGEIGVDVVFSVSEISVIRAFYHDHHSPDSRHKKGKKSLPPGIAKNLRVGKPLPPGIAKQVLPAGLVDLLPPAPSGFERIEIDGKILLVEVATQLIHDVLEDIIQR